MRSRGAAALASAAALLLLVAGCGGSSGTTTGRALTSGQAEQALLTVRDLPGTFTPVASGDDDQQQAGCLAATTRLDAVHVDVDERSAFVSRLPKGVSGALSQVRSDADTAVLQQAFTAFRSAVADCHTVRQSSASSSFDLAITTDAASGSGDDPIHLTAKGTLVSGGQRFDYHVEFVVSLLGHTITIVAAYDLGTVSKPLVADLTHLDTLVVDRVERLAG